MNTGQKVKHNKPTHVLEKAEQRGLGVDVCVYAGEGGGEGRGGGDEDRPL